MLVYLGLQAEEDLVHWALDTMQILDTGSLILVNKREN